MSLAQWFLISLPIVSFFFSLLSLAGLGFVLSRRMSLSDLPQKYFFSHRISLALSFLTSRPVTSNFYFPVVSGDRRSVVLNLDEEIESNERKGDNPKKSKSVKEEKGESAGEKKRLKMITG